MGHPVDKLISGLLLATAITMVALFGLTFAPVQALTEGARHAIAGLAISALIVFPRPLLLRTVWREKRSPFLLDEDLNNMLLGRAIGLVLGLVFAVWLAKLIG